MPATVASWGVRQQVQDLSLALSLSPCNSDERKKVRKGGGREGKNTQNLLKNAGTFHRKITNAEITLKDRRKLQVKGYMEAK